MKITHKNFENVFPITIAEKQGHKFFVYDKFYRFYFVSLEDKRFYNRFITDEEEDLILQKHKEYMNNVFFNSEFDSEKSYNSSYNATIEQMLDWMEDYNKNN